MAFKTHCNEREKKKLKTKRKRTKTPTAVARRESFSCNYIDFYVWLWRFTQSFTSRVACLLPQRDQLRTQSPPHLWAFKMSSDALTSTEAPWSLNCGIANSRKLYISTNALFWHNKSCVLIHMFLLPKKCNTLVVSGKFQMRNIWSPRQCLVWSFPSAFRLQESRPGKLNDQKQFLAISKWQEHLNKKCKRSLEIPIGLSIYL